MRVKLKEFWVHILGLGQTIHILYQNDQNRSENFVKREIFSVGTRVRLSAGTRVKFDPGRPGLYIYQGRPGSYFTGPRRVGQISVRNFPGFPTGMIFFPCILILHFHFIKRNDLR